MAINQTAVTAVTVDRQGRKGDNLNGDKCSHSGDRLSQNGEKATSQNGDDESLYFHGLKKLVWEVLVAHAFVESNDCYCICRVGFGMYYNNICCGII